MPIRDDPEVAMAALRWVLDQAYRPGDCLHIVHVIKCMVQRLEVYHGRCHSLCSSSVFGYLKSFSWNVNSF